MASLTQVQEELMKVNVSKWIEIKKQMKDLSTRAKELKSALTIIEKDIILTMKSNDIPQIQLSAGQLQLKVKESKKTLPPKWFKGEIDKCIASQSEDDIRESLNTIISKIDNRPSTVKDSLVFKS